MSLPETAANVIIVISLIWMALVVTIPLGMEALVFGRAEEEDKVPSSGTKTLQMVNICLVCAGMVFIGGIRFNSYGHTGEPKTNLGAIYTSQMEYFGEHHTYAGRSGLNGSGCFTDIGWGPEGETRYSYYCGGDSIPAAKPGAVSHYDPQGDWPVEIRPASSQSGFTIMAVNDVDKDEHFGVWMMSDSKELRCLICPQEKSPSQLDKFIMNWQWLLRHEFDPISFILLSPPLIIMLLTPFLFMSLRNDYRYYKFMREYRERQANKEAKPEA